MAKAIQHQLFYPKSPEIVWDYLTKPELMSLWLMPSDFKPVEGHEFQFTSKPQPAMDWDGIFHCKVLEIVPFKKLSYSWKFGNGDGNLNDSTVNWTLQEKDNGTELLLIHRGFEGWETTPIFAGMNAGWLSNMNKILNLVNPEADGTTPA